MKISTQAAKCLMGAGVSLLLLAAPVPLQGQPATAKTTSYTRYSEWMSNSLYNSAPTDYHYDYSLLYEAMMDTYLAYKNDASTKLETANVKKEIDTYAATCASSSNYGKSYNKSKAQLDYVRPLHFFIRYNKNIQSVKNYTTALSTVLGYMEDGTKFERLKNLKDDKLNTSYTPWEHKSTYPQQVWLDGTFMGLPFYTLAGPELNAGKASTYFADAASQLSWVDKLTYDSDKNLWRHAYDNYHGTSNSAGWADGKLFCWPHTQAEADAETNGRSAHAWARALGWYAMACMEVLDNMKANGVTATDDNYKTVLSLFQKIMKGVVAVQDASTGLWYQVLDANYKAKDLNVEANSTFKEDKQVVEKRFADVKQTNYLESTASAIFAYCLLKGVNEVWLADTYKDAAEKAYCGVVKQFVKEDGDNIKLTDCCTMGSLNLNKGFDGSYASYCNSFTTGPNDTKGTGPFIWASLQAEKLGYVLRTNSFDSNAPQTPTPTIQANGTPTTDPVGYTSEAQSQTVTITAPQGATIHYTTDGSDPTTASAVYTKPFKVYVTTTVKAISVKGGVISSVATSQIAIYKADTYDATTKTFTLDEMATDLPKDLPTSKVTVVIKRALKANVWNAMCLPISVRATSFDKNAEIQVFKGCKNNVFQFESYDISANILPAGTPFIIKPTKDISQTTINSKTVAADEPLTKSGDVGFDEGYTFVGTYVRTQLDPAKHRFLSLTTQKVVPPTGSNMLKGLRAYFTVPEGASAKEFAIEIGGVADKIERIDADDLDPTAPMYSVSGQRVGTGYRGIVIQNGRKFIIK